MTRNPRLEKIAVVLAGLAFALHTQAQAPKPAAGQNLKPGESYRCTGIDGKKYYGQTIPEPCAGVPLEIINSQGMVVRRIDAAADAKAREEREAKAKEKARVEAAQKDAQRRTAALLATYTSEEDIERARLRALEENKKALSDIEVRVAAIRKRQDGYKRELEFYTGKNKPPARLEQDIQSADIDLKALEDLRVAKTKEVDSINARYDEDKRRYAALVSGR